MLCALAGNNATAAPGLTAVAAAAWCAPASPCRGLRTSSAPASSSSTEVVMAVAAARQERTKDHARLSALAHSASALATAGQLSPEQIRDVLAALAELGFHDVGFKSAMTEAILPKMSAYEPAVLADIVHSYGLGPYYDYELMTEAVNYLKANADRFDATSLAKMLWSFGRCGYQDDALMRVMHSVAEKLADSCDSTSLADVVYAEAQMGWADQRLAELVADYATVNIETFDANSLARLLAGLASVGYDDDELADAAGRHACSLLEAGEMSPSHLVSLMWAYGLQGHYHKGLMAHAEAMLENGEVVDALSSDELHTLIDACNNLGMHGPGISAAAARLGRLVPTITDEKELPASHTTA
ncbi:hypothetical protein MNEG_0318 [Monoraphidium neglectum]|uniref:Pentatricopeptide repeat-containing protein n=1 Tax=Monoraphidium neglectum TaxID=145388 RepID=A0A0D2KC72_9CHLO|nr:hypothetical protein MNEG_0318 [Monoraphidium neglectum]KIZ07648.1 hypothetical protein MNEG_0318 [Monoraphidium neglectum]|eukprot:XP_013906667.1 hypothetical protein MNEG_0318 [Monoraphidium neglectum]